MREQLREVTGEFFCHKAIGGLLASHGGDSGNSFVIIQLPQGSVLWST